MADSDVLANAVLEALGFALFVRKEEGALFLSGKAPDWLRDIWPGVETSGARLPLDAASPFLENFLIDAKNHWQQRGAERLRSGPWIEQSADGTEQTLEAIALSAGDHSLLLLGCTGRALEEKRSMLQKARETTIAYQRLESEMEKKEILLSTIAEGMNATLANIITSLHLLELENNSSRTRQLLVLAIRATTEQQMLIHKILNLFSAELEALYGREGGGTSKAKLESVLRSVEAGLAAAFNEKKVRLTKSGEAGPDLEIVMEPAHLQRVLTTLLENALARAPACSDVQLEIRNEPESIVLRIIDGGAPQSDEMPKMDPGMDSMSESELRLRFCRVAVENCQGEIGREEVGEEGNCFWIRLPKAVAVS